MIKRKDDFMTDRVFAKIYKLLSVTAVISVVAPIVYFFFYRLVPEMPQSVFFIMTAIPVAVGYAMQSFYGKVTSSRHNSRDGYDDDSGYEASVSPFKPIKAAVPIVLSAVIAVIVRVIADKLMYNAYVNGYIYTYDSNSLYPYIAMLLVFALNFVGIALWFYPPHRIISLRSMLTCFGGSSAVFAMSVMMSVPTEMQSFSLVLFFACASIVLNQTYISRRFTGVLTAISTEGKYYNGKLMVFIALITLVIMLIIASVFTGIAFVLKFAFIYIAVKIVGAGGASNDDYYYDVSDAEADFSDVMISNQPIGDKLLLIACVIIFIAAIVFFAFRGHSFVKKLTAKLKQWFREIFMFFMNMREYKSLGISSSYGFANYTDETIKLQDAAISPYDKKAEKKRSYREFVSYLNSLPTASDQIRYAYVTMLSVFRSLGYGIKRSETPRETKLRVAARSANNNLDSITDAIEAVDYIEKEPSEEKCDEAIKLMCRIIRNNFEE